MVYENFASGKILGLSHEIFPEGNLSGAIWVDGYD